MARRKRTRKVSTRRYSPKRVRSRRRSGLSGEMALMLGAGIYGAARSKLSGYLSQFTGKIPLGNVSDEVGLAVGLHFAGKTFGNKVPLLKEVVKAGKTIEYARIGEAVVQNDLGLGMNNNKQKVNQISSFR